MRFRKLRIAWSVGWGILCLLLIALWVRSYWYLDEFTELISRNHAVSFMSVKGKFAYYLDELVPAVPLAIQPRGLERYPVSSGYARSQFEEYPSWEFINEGLVLWTLRVPHWALVAACATFAAIPWVPRRFSLRTLLIAITLIGSILGTIIALGR
jgi:hypothetical protein